MKKRSNRGGQRRPITPIMLAGVEVLSYNMVVPTDPCDIKLSEAIIHAIRAANLSMLPKTVYLDADHGGWCNATVLSQRLVRLRPVVALTVLPERFFY